MPFLKRRNSGVALNCSAVSGGASRALLSDSSDSVSGPSAMLRSLRLPGQLLVGEPATDDILQHRSEPLRVRHFAAVEAIRLLIGYMRLKTWYVKSSILLP
jgi:hypothetical protein